MSFFNTLLTMSLSLEQGPLSQGSGRGLQSGLNWTVIWVINLVAHIGESEGPFDLKWRVKNGLNFRAFEKTVLFSRFELSTSLQLSSLMNHRPL